MSNPKMSNPKMSKHLDPCPRMSKMSSELRYIVSMSNQAVLVVQCSSLAQPRESYIITTELLKSGFLVAERISARL